MSSFFEHFQSTVARHPDRPALTTPEGGTVTWRTLSRRVNGIGALLAQRGVTRNDRVGILLDNEPAFIEAFIALSGLGVAVVPLNTQLTGASLDAVLRDSGLRVLITRNAKVPAGTAFDGVEVLIDVTDWAEIDVDVFPLVDVKASDPLAILYTSGTTGDPKGAQLSHTCFLAGAEVLIRAVGMTEEDRVMVVLPMFHANPQIYALTSAVMTGACLILIEKFSASRFWSDARRFKATGFTYVGTILSILQKGEPTRDHRVRWCTGGGAPESAWAALEDGFGVDVCELYGMTETGGIATINARQDRVRGTCGKPRPDMELMIVDQDDEPCAEGEMGEIVVRPARPGVLFDCYINKPEITLRSMRNLWFHTGDMGVWRQGRLVFRGRKDHVIRRGGENVSPGLIEDILMSQSEIREAAVVGVEDAILGQEIKAVLVLRAGVTFDPVQLIQRLMRDLPLNCVPRYLEVVAGLPKTPSEKVRTSELINTTGQLYTMSSTIKRLSHDN